MELIVEKTVNVYDLSQIKAGDLFYGRHRTWSDGKAGIVTTANERELIIQYHPGIANVTNHFTIPVNEVYAGEWEARWSHDMSEVYEYSRESEEEETEVEDESGTTDI